MDCEGSALHRVRRAQVRVEALEAQLTAERQRTRELEVALQRATQHATPADNYLQRAADNISSGSAGLPAHLASPGFPLCTGSHCSAPDPLGRLRYDRLAACCVTTLTSACRLVLLQQVIVTSEAESLALVYKVCSRLCVRALVRACVHGCDGDCVEMRCASLECVLSALASCTTRRHVADARVPARVLHR